ncbi:MAG: hypothetical protein II838_05875 [Lachnospiraceae bacterium]|nr:hypothetical protein [Lachnospiraceae bacterium]
MGNVVFDYSALSDAKSYAKKVVTGWGCMDSYKDGIKGKLSSPLDEWRLSGDEPYGRGYVSSAQQCITNKQNDLQGKRQQWIDLSDNLGKFLQYLKDTDDNVVKIFSSTSSSYVNYSGIGGFFNRIGDSFYNTFAVDWANSNGFTRTIFDWGKSVADDVSYYKKQAEDWFKHGNGRYVLNIVGSVALTTVAVVGTVIAFIGIPFSGGSSAVIAVGCIGTIASGISAVISACNTYWTIKENNQALSIEGDPAMARFHGDVSKYSDYVEKTDFGSAEANQKAAKTAQRLNTTQAVADVVSVGCTMATTFGTKSVRVVDKTDKVKNIKKFDISPSNVKTNVLKTFGFKVDKTAVVVDEAGITKTTTISNLDDMGNSSIEIVRESQEATYKATTFKKTVDIADGKKTITKTLTLDKASMSTEYGSVVASNGAVTQEVAAYSNHASASRTVIDYTTASSSAKSVAAAKAASDSKLKKGLTLVKNTASRISNTSTYLKADDDTQRNIIISNIVKKNYFVSQVDKYIIKYDPNKKKVKVYPFGDLGKKTEKTWTEGKKSWDLLGAN